MYKDTYIKIYICMCIYAHVVMEAEKSQDWPSASFRYNGAPGMLVV